MIRLFRLAISILIISSLLTACAKKPEYYQAAYSQNTDKKIPNLQGAQHRTKDINNRKAIQPTHKDAEIVQIQKRSGDDVMMFLMLPIILIIGGIAYATNPNFTM